MKNCRYCGNQIPDNADFCPYCGSKQEKLRENVEGSTIFCPKCGMKLRSTAAFCPNCGRKLSSDSAAGGNKRIVPTVPPKQDGPGAKNTDGIKSRGLLTVLGILFAVLFLYDALQYFPLLSYYGASYKFLGVLLIVVYLLDAGLLFLIAIYARRENGRYLLYGLYLGFVLTWILHRYASSTLGYTWESVGKRGTLLWLLLIAAGFWYLMNKQNLLQSKAEYGTAGDVIKGIPTVIGGIISSGKKANGAKKETVPEDAPQDLSPVQKMLWCVSGSKWALVLCIAFTGDLFYRMFFQFSVFSLVGYIFSIFIGIGLWMVYFGCKNNTLNADGFSMINAIIAIEMTLWMIVAIILAFIGISVFASESYGVGILIIVVAVLLGWYWLMLHDTAHCACGVAKGTIFHLHSSMWTIVILALSSVWRIMSFIWKLSLQFAANQTSNSIMQYSSEVSSDIAYFLEEYGIAYQYGYGEASSWMQTITEPVINWIQNTFGLQESVFGMLVALLIPLGAVVILIKMRAKGE